MAVFQTDTILLIEDPGRRVKAIYDTRVPIGVYGARSARLVRTDPSCHLELRKSSTPANPDPRLFYQQVLKRSPIDLVADYSLGLVDLGTKENNVRRRFPRSIEIELSGAASEFWTHLVRFNPGGLIKLNPRSIKYSGSVGSHSVMPQYAGLAALVEQGLLTPLPRNGQLAGVSGSRLSVKIKGTTYRPGGGDYAIIVGGMTYCYENPEVIPHARQCN